MTHGCVHEKNWRAFVSMRKLAEETSFLRKGTMRFQRRIDLANETCPLVTLDRHLQRRDIQTTREKDVVHAELFQWADLFRTEDPERLAWRRLRLAREGETLHLRFEYNWALQAVAHLSATVFTFLFLQNLKRADTAPLISLGLNAALLAGAFWNARMYAKRMALELERTFRRD